MAVNRKNLLNVTWYIQIRIEMKFGYMRFISFLTLAIKYAIKAQNELVESMIS